MSLTELAVIEGSLAFADLLAIVTLALGVIAVTPGKFKLARNCFWASCAIFTGFPIMWGVTTDYSFVTRAVIVGILAALAAVAAVEFTRFITREQKESQPKATAPRAENVVPNPEAKGSAKSHIEASVPKLFMECVPANLPTVWPSGPLYVLQLNPIPAPYGNGLGEYGVNSGSPVNFGFQGMVYRCQITNYSETPIFNSAISLHFTFREAIKKASQYEGGPITIDRDVSDPNVSDKEARAAANCMVLHPACHDDPVEFYNLHGFYPDNLRRK